MLANISTEWPLFSGTNLLVSSADVMYTWVQSDSFNENGVLAYSLKTGTAKVHSLPFPVFTAALNATTGVIYAVSLDHTFTSIIVNALVPPYTNKTVSEIAALPFYQIPAPNEATLLGSQFIFPYTDASSNQLFVAIDINTGANVTVRGVCECVSV